jgi:hypothetical protein
MTTRWLKYQRILFNSVICIAAHSITKDYENRSKKLQIFKKKYKKRDHLTYQWH